jgi:pilus assembly protein CpaD
MSVTKLFARRLTLSVAALALSVPLAGCERLDNELAAELSEPTRRHPISFASAPETLFVEVPRDSRELSPDQEADVYRFVQRYKAESSGPLRIGAPKSISGHLKSSGIGRQIEAIVRGSGIDANAVETSRSAGLSPTGTPALALSYDKVVALAPQCPDWATNVGENHERLPYNNWGCSMQRNIALNVANGRDLQQAQQETPRSAERREVLNNAYSNPVIAKPEGYPLRSGDNLTSAVAK